MNRGSKSKAPMPKINFLFAIFVVTLSFLIIPVASSAQEQDVSILESEKDSLRKEVTELEAQIEEYRGELGEKQKEISSLNNQIYIINTRISKINSEIKRTQNKISITKINISQTQVEIDNAVAAIERKKATLAELLRNISILDDESLLERMLKYNSLSQVLSDAQYLNNVQEDLNDVLTETRQEKRNLEVNEENLNQNKKELENKNRQLSVQKSAQNNEKSYRDSILSKTRQEEQKYQELLTEAETERADFMRRIATIEDQILIQQNFVSYFKAGEIPPPGSRIFAWPEDEPTLTQGFGRTTYARRGAYGGKGHNGIDMVGGLAAPIKAAAGGKIAAKGSTACTDYVNRSCNAYWGNWVAIEHPGGLVTLYSHMTKPSHKSTGDNVQVGEVIGYEGATGNVTGPHLHFSVYTEFFTYKDPSTGEIRFSYNYEKTLNPLDYL